MTERHPLKFSRARTTFGFDEPDSDMRPVDDWQDRVALVRRLIATDSPIILDIGANDGGSSENFLKAFPLARIYAFEPDPRAVERFESRMIRTGVQLFQTAIGAMDGWTDFNCSDGIAPWLDARSREWDKSGSIKAPKTHLIDWPWVRFGRKINVPITTLDSWMVTLFDGPYLPIDLIWADVQGAEGDLIDGAPFTLRQTRYFFTEYSDREQYEGQPTLRQLCERLSGFRIVKIFADDVLFENQSLAGRQK